MRHELTADQLHGHCWSCPRKGNLDECRKEIDCCGFGTQPWHVLAMLKSENASDQTVNHVKHWIELVIAAKDQFDKIKRLAERGPYGS